MSKLSFRCSFKSYELQSMALPVEIRKPNLALVAQTLSTQSVDLQPGTYYVTARLPAGQELYNKVTVIEDVNNMVVLSLDPEDVSPNESLEILHYIIGQKGAPFSATRKLEKLGSEDVVSKLRVFSGNVLQGTLLTRRAELWLQPLPAPSLGVAKFDVHASDLTFVQLLQPKVPPINVALLVVPRERDCELVLTRLSDDLLSIDVHSKNVMAEALLQYYKRGLLEQAATLVTSQSLNVDREIMMAEELLAEKVNDPIAATIGAYIFLRLGDLDRLRDWTRNLRDWFEWLPDGIPIRAEHLARDGEHDRAFRTLIDLPSRGLPIFSDGLSYAIGRLRLYVHSGESFFEKAELLQAQVVLEQLQQFAAFVNFRKPILTFHGIKPDKPDDVPLSEDIEVYEGIDVSEHLG